MRIEAKRIESQKVNEVQQPGQEKTVKVFVYGSLLQGFWNHERCLKGARLVSKGMTNGRLYHLKAGYPAVTPGPQEVYGEVYEVDEKTARLLDSLEGYSPNGKNNHYEKILKKIKLETGEVVDAYMYVWRLDQFKARKRYGAVQEYVKSGNWREYMNERGVRMR